MRKEPYQTMEGLSVRVPGPLSSGEEAPQAQRLILLVFFKRRLPKSVVTWQNRNLSFRILEEDTMDRLDAMSTFLAVVEAGSSYLAACKRILADVTEAERMASGEFTAPTGELTVTAPVSLGRTHLIPILAEFLKTYPDIRTDLILTDRVQSLFQEQVDVGLRIGTLPD